MKQNNFNCFKTATELDKIEIEGREANTIKPLREA